MRGMNKVILSGNVTGTISYAQTGNGTDVCTFILASDRHAGGGVVTAYIKVNVYIEGLVSLCRNRLDKGCYLLVEGELMNRNSPIGRVVEVRAHELIFVSDKGGSDASSRDRDSDGVHTK